MTGNCRQIYSKQKLIGIILLLLNKTLTWRVFCSVSDPLYTSHLVSDVLILTRLKERLLSCQNTSCINDSSSSANGTHFRQWKLMKENKSCQRHCFSVCVCLHAFKKKLWWKGQAERKRDTKQDLKAKHKFDLTKLSNMLQWWECIQHSISVSHHHSPSLKSGPCTTLIEHQMTI